jgi:hypothetical protein
VGFELTVLASVRMKTVHASDRSTTVTGVKLYLYRPWRPLGLREIETLTFSDIRLTDGGKAVSPTRRPLFTPSKIPDTHFS